MSEIIILAEKEFKPEGEDLIDVVIIRKSDLISIQKELEKAENSMLEYKGLAEGRKKKIQSLQTENEQLREGKHQAECNLAIAKKGFQAEVEQLRLYAQHKGSCPYPLLPYKERAKCTCGLNQLLNQSK